MRIAVPDIVVHVYPQHVEGTVLLQLIDDERLRAEAFPGLSADQVNGFTEAAAVYKR